MGVIISSLCVIALGCILRYGVTAAIGGVILPVVGLILMIVGLIGLVLGIYFKVRESPQQRYVRR